MKPVIYKIIVACLIQELLFCMFSKGSPVINQNDSVIFDLSQTSCMSELATFPVRFVSDDPIYAVDFSMKFNQGGFAYVNIVNVQSGIVTSAYFNSPDSTLRFTSYSGTPMISGSPLINLQFSLPGNMLSVLNFDTVTALLNGDACSYGFIATQLPMSISVTGPTTLNPGDSAILSVTYAAGLNYLWSTGQSTWQITVNQPGTYSVSVGAIQGCSSLLSVSFVAPNPLPVELIYFRGSQKQKQVMLEWATASETFSSHYLLQKADITGEWTALDSIRAAGFSTNFIYYQTSDPDPKTGVNFYRLQQVDLDGRTTTFNPVKVTVELPVITSTIQIIPNPFDPLSGVLPSLKILTNESYGSLEFLDSKGRSIAKLPISNTNEWFDLSLPQWLPSGMYYIIFRGKKERIANTWIIH